MKICVSSTMNQEDAVADRRFGRCPYFAIYDNELATYHYLDNSAIAEAHGAGIKAAQSVLDAGVEVVITGNVGPNAMGVLEAGKIKIYGMQGNKVEDQIKLYEEGRLDQITTPGAPHGGMGRHGQ